MKIGVCLPYMEKELNRDILFHWIRAIDNGPFHSITCGERITAYTVEMRTMLGAAAALTERVRIVPSLYVLPMHNAVWAAKEIATLDLISNGRVTVTVGVGGRPMDYEAVGAPFEHRHARMDEQVAAMREIWRGVPPLEGGDPVGPTPVQEGGPPILAGTMGPVATKRVAAWADGLYMWSGNGQAPEIQRMITMADEAWQEAGRTTPPRRFAGFWASLADDAAPRMQAYVYDYLKVLSPELASAMSKGINRCTPDAINESLDAMEELGCEETYLVPTTCDLDDIDRMSELVAKRG
ncbi:MAG: alkanesulfonate monooxygenase SsuD [Myxococcota bacterium]|jgi:alkanesulfonate monooxygenase SsuD/methylene tetrahydromethanopterin reductase-like flavin-dependent oxidoreductase (luciferase family)